MPSDSELRVRLYEVKAHLRIMRDPWVRRDLQLERRDIEERLRRRELAAIRSAARERS